MNQKNRRKKTSRFEDIARNAGVSVATVDRVLNERESVAAGTRERVLAAARRLDTRRILPDSHHGVVHIEVLLPTNQTPFYRRLGKAFQRHVAILDKRIIVHRTFVPEHDERQFAKAILSPSFPRRGLILSAPDTLRVRSALQLRAQEGEPMASVVSQVSGVHGLAYVGIDHYRAGRTAGLIIGRFAREPGPVLLLSGKQSYRGHLERISGCRDGIAACNPLLDSTTPLVETRDDDSLCFDAVARALASGLRISGIYNSGAGSGGIEAALKAHAAPQRIVWITHELSDDHRALLDGGRLDMVIDQDPERQAMNALQHVLHAGGLLDGTLPPVAATDFHLHFAANNRSGPYL